MDDSELVRRMLEGDERAFNDFFETYFPRVYRFALPRLGGDCDTAREVVQATLIKAIRSLPGFRSEAALFTWVCQICRSQIVDRLRADRRHAMRFVPIDDQPEVRAAFESIEAPQNEEPFHRYGNEETRRLIRVVLDRLPARYGDILEWKYVDGESVAEIGERLGVGHIAAQSMLARARTSFKEALETVFGSTAPDMLAGLRGGE